MNQNPSIKRLIVVDLSSFIFRSYYAIRPLTSPQGLPVNSVYGVCSMLLKLIDDFRPTYLVMARDGKEKSFRSEIYPQYKANRSAPPDDLIPQFALIDQLVVKMNLPNFYYPGYEADDVIGTIVTGWKDLVDEVFIVSGDKDLMQFVGQNVFMMDTKIEKIYDAQGVYEKMGVHPHQIVDYLSLVGDASDNIPGLSGVGAKGACKMLGEYGNLDMILQSQHKIKNKRVQDALENKRDELFLSKRLVEIECEIPLEKSLEDTRYEFSNFEVLNEFLLNLGFKSLLKRVKEVLEKTVSGEKLIEGQATQNENENENKENSQLNFETIQLKNLDDALSKIDEMILNAESVQLTYLTYYNDKCDELEKLTFTLDGKTVFVLEKNDEFKLDSILIKIFQHKVFQIFTADIKKDFLFLYQKQVVTQKSCLDCLDFFKIKKYFDVLVGHYLVDVEKKHSLHEVINQYFDETEIKINQEVIYIDRLKHTLSEQLISGKMEPLFYDVEMPLTLVLASMEYYGVYIEQTYFKELTSQFQNELGLVEEEIKKIIGEEKTYNLRSPKQVGELLFEKLKLPIIKKTKTGSSTDSEVLEELSLRNLSPVPDLILKYREIDKLLSTYVLALPQLIDPKTNRIHTRFQQMVTATGRLSSDRPNLQNIPIRSENGKLVRRGFKAPEGKELLSADYSQIELRILAHMSEESNLLETFKNDGDIHRQTAAQVLGIGPQEVTKDQRDSAKAVNFGLLYGQTSFGLARTLRISREEAKNYIVSYFSQFPGVKGFLDSLKEKCLEKGWSETLWGRRRYLPDIKSKNINLKNFAERLAVNTPIQGTAADIIKVAMIKIFHRITLENLSARMILQVHDELVFEVSQDERDKVKELVLNEMQNVCPLKVPLKVDMSIGVNWYDID
jgi:DNA polymerase-1